MSRWAEAWRATEGSRGEVSAVSTASTPNIGMHLESRGSNVKSLPKDDGDLQAIYAEPALPAPGTPERERHDKKQSDMVAGLLAGYAAHRSSG